MTGDDRADLRPTLAPCPAGRGHSFHDRPGSSPGGWVDATLQVRRLTPPQSFFRAERIKLLRNHPGGAMLCRTCGAALAGRTRRARYCSDLCRVRYARGQRPPPVVEAPAEGPRGDLMGLDELAGILTRVLLDPATPARAKPGLSRELRAVRDLIEAPDQPPDELADRRAVRVLH